MAHILGKKPTEAKISSRSHRPAIGRTCELSKHAGQTFWDQYAPKKKKKNWDQVLRDSRYIIFLKRQHEPTSIMKYSYMSQTYQCRARNKMANAYVKRTYERVAV
jgi:hypothetical protein